MNNPQQDLKKLGQLIKGIKIAMLTTRESDGSLRSRPMATQEAEFEGVLWFFTKIDSPKVDEIDKEHEVNVAYSDPSSNKYVSVSGLGNVVRDRGKIDELWTPMMKAWFPQGKDDPQLALLRVDVNKAEYWNGPASTLIMLAGLAKALVHGKEYKASEHEKLEHLSPT